MSFSNENTPQWLKDASPSEMHRVIETLYRVHGLAAALTDINLLLERISEEGRLLARAEGASVMLYDEEKDELWFHIVVGEGSDGEALKQKVRLTRGQGIAGAAALEGKVIHVPDVDKDPRFFRGADIASCFRTRNILAIPMFERKNLVGVLELVNKTGNQDFTPLDQHIMEIFAALTASTVVNARLIETQIKNERLTAIGHAIAGLTHHIKNILTGLTSSAELIELAFETNDFDLIRKTWPVMQRSIKRISNFVQDLLVIAKPTRPPLRECHISQVVTEACETMHDLLVKKGVHIEILQHDCVPPVYGDSELLLRCVMNILANAVDAVKEGVGRITIQIAPYEGHKVEVRFIDNGLGVAPEIRDKIFGLFFSTKGGKGIGLGLACSEKIAREHGGSLALLESDEGACFQLVLPAMKSNSIMEET